MTDFEYECKKRKDLARQAKHRKCGSKSKKCSLSTDYMTNRQWKERNGTVMSINMNNPVSWEDFKGMSLQTQKDYISNIIDTYNANASTLSEMFGVSASTVRKYLQENDFGISFKVGHSMTSAQRSSWEAFINQQTVGNGHTENETEETVAGKDKQNRGMGIDSFSLSFSGVIDVDAIANSLRRMMVDGASANIEIKCTMV